MIGPETHHRFVQLPARMHGALARLQGDAGARSVIQANAAAVTELPVDDAGIFEDVDTREDLARIGS